MGGFPIKIDGWNNFAVVTGIEDFLFGTFCGGEFGENLEQGIETVIDFLKIKARNYLIRLAEGTEEQYGDEYEDLAFKIVTHQGNVEDLFFIKYAEHWKEKVEPQLGRYNKLERKIVKS